VEISPGHCLIREWRRGNAEALVRHANNLKISRNLRDRFRHPRTLNDAHWWIDHAGAEIPPSNFAIVVDGEASRGIPFLAAEFVLGSIEIRSSEFVFVVRPW
jgi:hypothetical protein